MACTVAVEESISEHYNSQIRALMEKDPERYVELLHVSQTLTKKSPIWKELFSDKFLAQPLYIEITRLFPCMVINRRSVYFNRF